MPVFGVTREAAIQVPGRPAPGAHGSRPATVRTPARPGVRTARSRIPGLDGIRAVAVLLVVAGHAEVGWLNPGGSFGVTLFFVLSGYLITGLLVTEYVRDGRIDLRRFWRRRALRLLPALSVMIAVISVVSVADHWLSLRQWWHSVVPVLLYYADYVPAGRSLTVFDHTWSLAVEEQFYLVWPLLLLGLCTLARRHRWILGSTLALLTALGITWRLHLGSLPTNPARYTAAVHHLDTCAWALAAGATLATTRLARPGYARRIPGWVPAALLLGAVVAADRAAALHVRLDGVTAPLLFGAVGLVTIIACAGGGARWLENPVLGWIGRRSYAWYLWHLPLIWAVLDGPVRVVSPKVDALGAAVLALGCAELSWWFVERPCLALRVRQSAAGRRPVRPLAAS